jgi:hypothetical protein
MSVIECVYVQFSLNHFFFVAVRKDYSINCQRLKAWEARATICAAKRLSKRNTAAARPLKHPFSFYLSQEKTETARISFRSVRGEENVAELAKYGW